jgi:hypothetical protein
MSKTKNGYQFPFKIIGVSENVGRKKYAGFIHDLTTKRMKNILKLCFPFRT